MPIYEKHHDQCDIVLVGVLDVLRSLFTRYPNLKTAYGINKQMIYYLIHDCLFKIPVKTKISDA
jgi:hypothetical protein